jgi:ADP-ribose pyrophosphatase YjhB (NUDIX family)
MRAQVVVLRDQQILMARHERNGKAYWVLPGGSIEEGETAEEAAMREMREECGAAIRIERLLFVDDPRPCHEITIKEPRYTFLGVIARGEVTSLEDRHDGTEEKGHLAGVEWLPLDFEEFDGATRDTIRHVQAALML